MKKLLFLLLVTALMGILVLSACTVEEPEDPEKVSITVMLPGETKVVYPSESGEYSLEAPSRRQAASDTSV